MHFAERLREHKNVCKCEMSSDMSTDTIRMRSIYGAFLSYHRAGSRVLKSVKATAYRLAAPQRSYSFIGHVLFFLPRHPSTLRLAGTRYSRVTVKLSFQHSLVFGESPRPLLVSYRSPSNARTEALPYDKKKYGARRNIFFFFAVVFQLCNFDSIH